MSRAHKHKQSDILVTPMAKKKKHSKKQIRVEREPNMFLRGVWAVMLFVLALFLLIGGFGQGGPLPKGLFNGTYTAFGIAAYLLPVALIFGNLPGAQAREAYSGCAMTPCYRCGLRAGLSAVVMAQI